MKSKTSFFCTECGNETAKWTGQCPACKAWNTLVEEPAGGKSTSSGAKRHSAIIPEVSKLSEIEMDDESRTLTGIREFDRVLGGGVVASSMILVGGDPGIGKSTLLLQVCRELSNRGKKVLYVSGEESLRQIKMRAERLGGFSHELSMLSETSLDAIEAVVEKEKPDVMVIDSIQTMYREDISSSPGSVSQVRESTGALLRIAKNLSITVFIVGHVTKEGTVAGPRMLEHMVDTVLYFEGDNSAAFRILRAVKNRFGSTNEIGVFEMRGDGLSEVPDPSAYMLQGHPEGEPGSVIAVTLEGTRPIMVEIQALVCQTSLNIPRRTATGADYNRVSLLMAVIEKKMRQQLAFCDAYINVAGGMKITEPAIDLAVVAAILSSFKNAPLSSKTAIFGEVGLTGEIRGVNQAELRVMEAAKLGYESVILPEVNARAIRNPGIRLVGISNIREMAGLLRENNE